jgi:hypothetical protein
MAGSETWVDVFKSGNLQVQPRDAGVFQIVNFSPGVAHLWSQAETRKDPERVKDMSDGKVKQRSLGVDSECFHLYSIAPTVDVTTFLHWRVSP